MIDDYYADEANFVRANVIHARITYAGAYRQNRIAGVSVIGSAVSAIGMSIERETIIIPEDMTDEWYSEYGDFLDIAIRQGVVFEFSERRAPAMSFDEVRSIHSVLDKLGV